MQKTVNISMRKYHCGTTDLHQFDWFGKSISTAHKNSTFSCLVKSNPVKLETSLTVICTSPYGECSLVNRKELAKNKNNSSLATIRISLVLIFDKTNIETHTALGTQALKQQNMCPQLKVSSGITKYRHKFTSNNKTAEHFSYMTIQCYNW